MFCRSLFVLLYFFFWPLCCLFFFDIRILIAPLVSSSSCCHKTRVVCCKLGSISMVRAVFFFMLEVKLRNSTSIKLMNYCIDKYAQVILCLFAYSDVLHVLTNGRHELLALHRRLGSHPPVFGGVRVASLFSFLYCVFLFVFCLFLSSSCVLCAQLYNNPIWRTNLSILLY